MNAQDGNPYQAPESASPTAPTKTLPKSAIKKASNLVRDAKLSAVVGLIPVLGLIFILRLVQWYLLRKQCPILAEGDAGEHAELAKQFRSARSSLWFAVLFWPCAVLFLAVYLVAT